MHKIKVILMSLVLLLHQGMTENISPRDYPVRIGGNKFFVSSINGDDGNDGRKINAPWKTLGKLTEEIYSGNVLPTDSVLLERGSIFNPDEFGHSRGNGQRGLINLPKDWHGEPDSWFYIGTYGEGEKPVISDENIAKKSSAIHSQGSVKYVHIDSLRINGPIRFDIYSQEMNKGAEYIKLTNLFLDGGNRDISFYMRPAFEHRHPYEYHQLTLVGKIRIEGCVFVNQGGEDVLNFSGPTDSIYIGYNKIYGAVEECLDISGGIGHVVEYNLFEGSGDDGQTIKIHSQHRRNEGGVLRGNIVTANSSVKFAAAFNNISDWEIRDNIFFNPNGWSIGLSGSGGGSNPPQMYYWNENDQFLHNRDIDNNYFEGNAIVGKSNVQWWQNAILNFPNGIVTNVDQKNILDNNIFVNNIFHPGNSNQLMRVQYFEGPVEWTTNTNGRTWQCGDPPNRSYSYYDIGMINKAQGNSGNSSILSALISNFTASNQLWHVIRVHEGWNLLSLPAIPSGTLNKALFPEASPDRFYYFRNGGYLPADSLLPGRGYWFYDTVNSTRFVPGIPINSLTYEISEGWNLIGSISQDVPVESVYDPDQILHDDTWYYFDGSAYVEIDTLKKGAAYWIYAKQGGTITIFK